MAIITALKNPYKYVELEAVPVENILTFDVPVISEAFYGGKEFSIKVTIGTFQFSSGSPITADSPFYTVDDVFFISLSEVSKLRILAEAQDNSFNISG